MNMTDSESEDSLIQTHNGSNSESSPDLVRLDADNLSDIIVSWCQFMNLNIFSHF